MHLLSNQRIFREYWSRQWHSYPRKAYFNTRYVISKQVYPEHSGGRGASGASGRPSGARGASGAGGRPSGASGAGGPSGEGSRWNPFDLSDSDYEEDDEMPDSSPSPSDFRTNRPSIVTRSKHGEPPHPSTWDTTPAQP